MVGRYATPEADVTITHHIPPPEDDSTRDVSVSFTIPQQADASNLLDQNYDDFLSGPGFVTLSTPVLPRYLANAAQSMRKVTRAIHTPVVLSSPNRDQTQTKGSTTGLELPGYATELQETYISPHSFPPLSPSTKPTTSNADPGPPRSGRTSTRSNPDLKIYGGPTSNKTPSVPSIVTTEACGTQSSIQSMPASHHSANPQVAQISRQFPTTAAQKKNKAPAQPREYTSVKPNQTISKSRSGGGLDYETTAGVSHVQLFQPSWDL